MIGTGTPISQSNPERITSLQQLFGRPMAAAINGSATETKLMWALDHEAWGLCSTQCEFRLCSAANSYAFGRAVQLGPRQRRGIIPGLHDTIARLSALREQVAGPAGGDDRLSTLPDPAPILVRCRQKFYHSEEAYPRCPLRRRPARLHADREWLRSERSGWSRTGGGDGFACSFPSSSAPQQSEPLLQLVPLQQDVSRAGGRGLVDPADDRSDDTRTAPSLSKSSSRVSLPVALWPPPCSRPIRKLSAGESDSLGSAISRPQTHPRAHSAACVPITKSRLTISPRGFGQLPAARTVADRVRLARYH